MRLKKTTGFTVSAALIVLFSIFISFFYSKLTRDTPAVTLPPPAAQSESPGPNASPTTDDTNTRVELTPETVQAVIATLVRPDSYSRTIKIELFSGAGSAVWDISSWIRPAATRLDILNNGSLQSIILTDENIYIWYNGIVPYYTGALTDTLDYSSDIWQRIPTYEDILELSKDKIEDAGYVEYDGVYCIYVDALSNELGYTEKYYIDLDLGLLIAAETYDGDTTVYKMTADATDLSAPPDDKFMLPDGEIAA